MRHSMASLLEVYLGNGPAERIVKGAFQRGQTTEIDAAVVITDLRGFDRPVGTARARRPS